MKIYRCENFNQEDPRILTYTIPDIIVEYWEDWYDQMVKKYGEDSELITVENCVDSWVVNNWAWEVKDETPINTSQG